MKKYKMVVSGGTFDRLHKGHEDFLQHQLSISDKVLLGITSDKYVRSVKNSSLIEPRKVRQQAVEAFLKKHDAISRVTILPIEDSGVPSSFDKLAIEAIVATEATRAGAEAINARREKEGLPPFPIEIVDLTHAADGMPISSTRIREGEIARSGKVYVPKNLLQRTYGLPKEIRELLKEPFGTLIVNNDFDYASLSLSQVITVGDIATKTLLERSIYPSISIVDFVVERQQRYIAIKDIGFLGSESVLRADNPAGTITSSLLSTIKQAFSKNTHKPAVIIVNGEEDLAVLPVLLFAPLGASVFYGQPGEGIVKIDVTEEKKEAAHSLIHRLTSRAI